MFGFFFFCLRALDDVDQIDDRNKDCRSAHEVCKYVDGEDTGGEQNCHYNNSCYHSNHKFYHEGFLFLWRQRVIWFLIDWAKEFFLGCIVADNAKNCENCTHCKCNIVAGHQCNGTGDCRRSCTDIGDNIGDCKRTVAAFILFFIHFAGQCFQASTGKHGTQTEQCLAGNIAVYTKEWNCQAQICNSLNTSCQTQCFSWTKHTVSNVAADDTGQNGYCRIQRNQLSCIFLCEAKAFRCCRIQVVNQDGAHAVVCKRVAQLHKAQCSNRLWMTKEALLAAQLRNLTCTCLYRICHKNSPNIALRFYLIKSHSNLSGPRSYVCTDARRFPLMS